jgi:gentisate 1,2-dioxygenase
MAGEGTTMIEGVEIDWAYGDTFVAPCWSWIEHAATSDSVVFSMSDEPLMRFANYHRFEGAE